MSFVQMLGLNSWQNKICLFDKHHNEIYAKKKKNIERENIHAHNQTETLIKWQKKALLYYYGIEFKVKMLLLIQQLTHDLSVTAILVRGYCQSLATFQIDV